MLIALVAIACIAGSLIASNEDYGVDYGRELVFHTPWFLGLMGLLLVNLCLCSWEKSYIALTLYKKRNFQKNPRFYENAGHGIAFPWKGNKDDLDKKLKEFYSKSASSDNAYYSQKGLLGRAGATIIHIGLLWTMAAGFYRILADDFKWGVYDATIILPEGQISSTYVTRKNRLKDPSGDNLKPESMPFAVKALDFSAEYFPHSTVAKGFASLVELSHGDFRRIYEVTMTNPIVYDGYKITQNSFSANERIRRGKFRILDTEANKFTEVDALPGDPVRLRGLDDDAEAFFQVDALAPDTKYHVLDLKNQKIIEEGTAIEAEDLPLPIDMKPFSSELAKSRYSIMVAALFPNFTFDENKQPTTKDGNFDNPAVMVMLFKNGRPNGYTWLFLNPEAQKIVGQPHPELKMVFDNYRRKDQSSDQAENLYNYEVDIKVTEKASGQELGDVWLSAGQLEELKVSDRLLKTANVRMDQLKDTHSNMESTSDIVSLSENDEAASSAITMETEAATTSSQEMAMAPEGRYRVEFLGMTSGNVTFLGFMKDPSVSWIFTGCIIIIAGTLIAFLLVYRETWCYYDEKTGLLYMATAVRGTSPSAHREFDRLVAQVKAMPQDSNSTSAATT